MTARKRHSRQEPLLSSVARRVGQAAGALTKVTHSLAASLSAFPQGAKAKAGQTGVSATRKAESDARIAPPRKKRKKNIPAKGIRKSTGKANPVATAKLRSRRNPRPAKKKT